MNILHLDSCALGNASASRRFTAQAVAALMGDEPVAVVYRDLAATPLSHVSGPLLQVLRGQWDPAIPMSAELDAEVLQAQLLLQEFMNADILVLGAPMYNFSMPSALKSWLDRILQSGHTVHVKDGQTRSRLKRKRIVIVSNMCSQHDAVRHAPLLDSQEAHLRAVFEGMAVGDVKVVRTSEWDGSVETFNEWYQDRLEAA